MELFYPNYGFIVFVFVTLAIIVQLVLLFVFLFWLLFFNGRKKGGSK